MSTQADSLTIVIPALNEEEAIGDTIEQCLAAKLVDRVIVATDSERIAQVSREAGAEVPFLRPAVIAGDTARAWEAFDHALGFR